ncbi:MAG: DUF4330 domain-containing protein [Defluviitaleaceae bacterium]|nr:DUF4330 domain-containing protein [Defluviitaleaceae bacterium]
MKDGKIFGVVNIIDLFIVIVLIGVAVFGIWQFNAGRGVIGIAPPETREFIISFFAEEVEDFTAFAVEVGAPVTDHGRNVFLGTVTAVEIDDARIWNADQYGIAVASPKPGFSSIEISARLTAQPTEHGIIIAGNRYGIGHSLAVRAGRGQIFMRISGLEEVG